ncbi:MAG: hypothetical protein FWC71_10515 [Defluviitaleaceae bacterium]|nr:hypothetical protein [Defluviitaleaceae bacterium]
MYCSKCGKNISKSVGNFCEECSTSVKIVFNSDGQPIINERQPSAFGNVIGMVLAVIGILSTIGGIIGIISVVNYANRPFNVFQFGGGSGWHRCASCETYTVILIISIPALIFGVISAIAGLVKIINK